MHSKDRSAKSLPTYMYMYIVRVTLDLRAVWEIVYWSIHIISTDGCHLIPFNFLYTRTKRSPECLTENPEILCSKVKWLLLRHGHIFLSWDPIAAHTAVW